MKHYHVVGKYEPRYVVTYSYCDGSFSEKKTFRSWENAWSFYRRKCRWCEDCYEHGEWYKCANVTLVRDGVILYDWLCDKTEEFFKSCPDCRYHCYKCNQRFSCYDSPLVEKEYMENLLYDKIYEAEYNSTYGMGWYDADDLAEAMDVLGACE